MTSPLGAARSPEFSDGAGSGVLIVPLGSTEQHGPHLPLATDTLIASAWADALAASLRADGDERVIVAPALPYGAAGEHQSFPGTLSIGTEVTNSIVIELARSAKHMVDRVVFLSGHAGNAEAVTTAQHQLRSEGHDIEVVLPVLADSDAHAGRTETSLMLHIAPDLVAVDQAAPGNVRPVGELMSDLRSGGVGAVSANGVLGDPSGASAEEGRHLLQRLVDHARAAIGK